MEPNYRINGLEFGRDHGLIREKLGEPLRIIKEYGENGTIEVYPSLHVYYSAKRTLEAVELCGKDISLNINSQLIYPGTLNNARKFFPDFEECHGSFISRAGSVGISVEGDEIISILAGCKDYYNR